MLLFLLCSLQDSLPVKLSSKHYEIRASTTREQAQELLDFMEEIHPTYSAIFHPGEEAERKRLPLLLHKDRDEYLKAGGPGGSGAFHDGKKISGYWDPDLMKACFAHEAVHHFVQITSRIVSAFPEWLHEGFADCLANFELRNGKPRFAALSGAIAGIRLPLLQESMHAGKVWKLSEFLSFGPKRFTESSPLSYAVAWSFCHFLMAYPLDEDPSLPLPDGKYRTSLVRYYELLSAGGIMADKAWARAFKDVSPERLEKEWREYVEGLGKGRFLGIRGAEATSGGVRVDDVVARSAAADAELRKGDRIVRFDGKELPRGEAWERLNLWTRDAGRSVRIEIERSGEKVELTLAWR